jgi:hypothetical protein
MNKYASPDELKAIAKQWNIDDFKFYMSLEVSSLLGSKQYSHLFIFRIGFLLVTWVK